MMVIFDFSSNVLFSQIPSIRAWKGVTEARGTICSHLAMTKKELKVERSLNKILHILGIALFEKSAIDQML